MDQLETSLALLSTGITQISVRDYPPDRYDEFQSLAEGIMQAKALGLVYEAQVERSKSRETYGHAVRVVTAGGLTPSGKTWLKEAADHAQKMKEAHERKAARTSASSDQPTPPTRTEEIIQLKPAFMGMSIDLKALWRRLATKRKK
ncbi:MAG: hypothetical protein ACXWT0_11120 [Methylobacter sp.]